MYKTHIYTCVCVHVYHCRNTHINKGVNTHIHTRNPVCKVHSTAAAHSNLPPKPQIHPQPCIYMRTHKHTRTQHTNRQSAQHTLTPTRNSRQNSRRYSRMQVARPTHTQTHHIRTPTVERRQAMPCRDAGTGP